MSKAAHTLSIEVGSVIANTYQIASILGRGGMGTVWEATHLRLPGKRVAIKVLHANIAEDPESLARFRREAEIACRLGHPNIVEVHDFNHLEDGSPYLILEMLEGQSLDARLREGPIALEECLYITRQIASALQCAHEQGVIHRDLKPQNIFLVPSPTGEGPMIVKVLDFGISKIRGSQTVKTQDSTLLGTPQYMAPEQATGNHESVDARTDLFALAAMLYELLSGKPAFSGESIPEVVYKVVHVEPAPLTTLVTGLPADKSAAIHRALNKAQDDRFPDIASFVEAFTGSPMAPPRLARAPRPANIGSAATIDSSKIDFAQAATFDSSSQEIPAASPPDAVADPIAETVDSSKLDRMQASIEITGGEVKSVDIKAIESASDTSAKGTQIKTYLISMVVVCGAAVAALVVMPKDQTMPAQIGASGSSVENHAESTESLSVAVVPELPSLDAGVVVEKTVELPANDIETALIPTTTKEPKPKITKAPAKADEQPEDVENESPESKALLAEAESALAEGRGEDALFAAQRAYRIQNTQRSLVIQAKAKCLGRHMGHVRAAMRKVATKNHPQIREFCKEVGFPLL